MRYWHLDLNEDEDLVVDERPHRVILVLPIFQLVLFLFLAALSIRFASSLPWWTILFPLAILLLILGRMGIRIAKYRASHLIVTTQRLIYVSGALRRRVREIPILQISNLTSSQRVFDRLWRCGSLQVEHAGEGGMDSFASIRRPDRIVRIISAQISRRSSLVGRSGFSVIDGLSKLAQLRKEGSISEQDYDYVKSKLLNQI